MTAKRQTGGQKAEADMGEMYRYMCIAYSESCLSFVSSFALQGSIKRIRLYNDYKGAKRRVKTGGTKKIEFSNRAA